MKIQLIYQKYNKLPTSLKCIVFVSLYNPILIPITTHPLFFNTFHISKPLGVTEVYNKHHGDHQDLLLFHIFSGPSSLRFHGRSQQSTPPRVHCTITFQLSKRFDYL